MATLNPEVLSLTVDRSAIAARYAASGAGQVLERVLDHAADSGAQSALVEQHYIDADYRSEHQAFYSKAFLPYSSVATRLHFLAASPEALGEVDLSREIAEADYVGYSVVRPVPGAPVGRTFLPGPAADKTSSIPPALEHVHLFGQDLHPRGYPFLSQDGELGRCSHAAVWTTVRYHAGAYGHPPLLAGEIGSLIPGGGAMGRAVPSGGLNLEQISRAFEAAGLPSIVYTSRKEFATAAELGDLGKVARRYLDSGFPVLVNGMSHTVVVTGYRAGDDGSFSYLVQDDLWGPGVRWEGERFHKPGKQGLSSGDGWEFLVAPLPEKVWLSPEKALSLGRRVILGGWTNQARRSEPTRSEHAGRIEGVAKGQIEFQVIGLESNEFKRSLGSRGYSDEVMSSYRYIPMPRWVWVVEAIGDDGVLEEVIVDCTDHLEDLRYIAHRTDDALVFSRPSTPAARPPKRDIQRLSPTDTPLRVDSARRIGQGWPAADVELK